MVTRARARERGPWMWGAWMWGVREDVYFKTLCTMVHKLCF